MEPNEFPIITGLCPKVEAAANAVLAEAKSRKLSVDIHSRVRSYQKQAELYALGRTVKNPDGMTPEKPMGQIVPFFNQLRPVKSMKNCLREMFGLQWGGRWTMAKDHTSPDYPHFQIRPMQLKTKHILNIVLKQGIEAIWEMA